MEIDLSNIEIFESDKKVTFVCGKRPIGLFLLRYE